MSELIERARVYLGGFRFEDGHDLIRELADRVDELETAEFVGRLPDYIVELETERDELVVENERLSRLLKKRERDHRRAVARLTNTKEQR